MSIIMPEIEILDRTNDSIRYLEHGWPTELCRWHSHQEYEIHLITETVGKAFIGDYIGEFSPGSLYFLGPNLPHNWITDQSYNEPVEIRDMLLQFNHQSIRHLTSGFTEFQEVNTLLDQSQSGIEFKDFDTDLAVKYLEKLKNLQGAERILVFLEFLLILQRHPYKDILSVVKLGAVDNTKKHMKINDVVDHVINNYQDDLSIGKAAALAGMSETSFSRNFQAVTGKRFTEFVNRVRIGQACVMLFETDEQISSICFDVGFQNLANFNRHFLKMKSMTPKEYRESARQNLLRSHEINRGVTQ